MSNTYIMSLIDDLSKEDVTKTAADKSDKDDKKDDKKKSDKKDDDKDDDKGSARNRFFDRVRDKKKDGDDAKDKKDAEKKAFDMFAEVADLPEEIKKLAAMEAEAEFFAHLQHNQTFGFAPQAAKAASSETDYRALFNEVYEDHTAKLASLDPEYAAILEGQQTKMAFNQGAEDAIAAVRSGLNPFAGFGG